MKVARSSEGSAALLQILRGVKKYSREIFLKDRIGIPANHTNPRKPNRSNLRQMPWYR